MDSTAYTAEAAIEPDHWWFVGRRLLFADLIKGFDLPLGAEILDVGTGTGTNLRLLRDLGFAHTTGVDRSPEAIRFCADKGLGIDDDLAALRELRRVMRPGGYLLLTVPAFRLLWGLQDEVSHHKRRYTLRKLLKTLRIAELSPGEHFYFNYLLFLPILVARRLMRILKLRIVSEGEVNTEWLNRMLMSVFRFDVKTAPLLRPPIGVSALVVAMRT
jgi:SAM-dependent methyltransferase